MADPTIDETRGDARVVVYGDGAPVTEQEWYCARLVWELYADPLVIAATGKVFHARAGLDAHAALVICKTRAVAVDALCVEVTNAARRVVYNLSLAARRAARLNIGHPVAITRQCDAIRALLAGAP